MHSLEEANIPESKPLSVYEHSLESALTHLQIAKSILIVTPKNGLKGWDLLQLYNMINGAENHLVGLMLQRDNPSIFETEYVSQDDDPDDLECGEIEEEY